MFLVAVYNNSVVRYDVDEQWNVLFLKQRVCQDLKINPDVHFLSCETQQGFRIMKEETKLIDYGLMSDCHIYVYMRPPRNQYFIFCYACENIRAATVTFNCSVCNSVFVPFKCDTNSLKCNGKCLSDFCVSNEAFVGLSCPVSPTHESKVFLRHIKQNVGRVDCAACASSEMENLISFCDDENHSLCIECFKKYATEYFHGGMFQFVDDAGYTIGCPAGCPNSFITDPHHFRILGPEFYSTYKEHSAKRYLILKGSTFCPSCGTDWQVTDDEHHLSLSRGWHRCLPPVGCGSLFCSSCGWHCKSLGSSSSQNSLKCLCGEKSSGSRNPSAMCNYIWKSLKLRTGDMESRRCINETCQLCPRCKSATQKSGGCNHIHCSLCGLDWCWVCCEVWTGECLSSHWL